MKRVSEALLLFYLVLGQVSPAVTIGTLATFANAPTASPKCLFHLNKNIMATYSSDQIITIYEKNVFETSSFTLTVGGLILGESFTSISHYRQSNSGSNFFVFSTSEGKLIHISGEGTAANAYVKSFTYMHPIH